MTNKNLSLFSFSYNEEIAAEAEPKGNYIDESGVYEGIINSVTVRESSNENSQSWWMRFAFTAEDGKEATRLDLLMSKSNGETFYTTQSGKTGTLQGVSIAHSIMGLLGIKSLHPVQGKEAIGFREFTGKKIAFALQKSLYTKDNGETGSKLNLIRAFEFPTLKTLTEKREGLEAKVCKMKIEDEDRRDSQSQPQSGSYASQSQPIDGVDSSELPF